MSVILCVAQFQGVSGLPRDVVQNSFVFESGTLSAVLAIGPPAVIDFYNNLHTVVIGGVTFTQTTRIGAYIGSQIARGATAHVKSYDITANLDGSPHGTPVQDDVFTLPASFDTPFLPDEVAACVSYHGDFTGLLEVGAVDTAIPTDEAAIDEGAPATHTGRDRPKQRHRGRFYIGPLTATGTVATTAPCHLNSIFWNDLTAATAKALLGLTGANWRVWSRRDAAVYTVTGGFVDNAFDTQRRRGAKATARVIY